MKVYTVKQLKHVAKVNTLKGFSSLNKPELYELVKNYIQTTEIPPRLIRNSKKRKLTKMSTHEQEEFIKNGYDIINPLQPKKAVFSLREAKEVLTLLQPHQEQFIKKYIFSNVQGAIMFHTVGTGKTLTAAVLSHYYLTINPTHNVVIISPPALLYNFVDALTQYGLNPSDARYRFETYLKFLKSPNVNNKTLIIVDEAHNFRTHIIQNTTIDPVSGSSTTTASQNQRGFKLLEEIKKCHKCLLLTGTPFINKLYDIENLISMVDKKEPLGENEFAKMTTNSESRHDYFKYKISHYKKINKKIEYDPNFPRVNNKIVPLVMSFKELKKYNKAQRGDLDTLMGFEIYPKNPEKTESFYLGTRMVSDLLENKKINYVMDIIKSSNKDKSIIYTTFISKSLNKYKQLLQKNNISFATISGNENANDKEAAKKLYNTNEIRVLLISKAGTEGVDTKETKNIFIVEPNWNEGLTEQAIARAVRYKSHTSLPKKEQYVNVFRLLVVKPNDVELIGQINAGIIKGKEIDYSNILKRIKNERMEANNKKKKLDKIVEYDEQEIKKLKGDEKKEYFEALQHGRYSVENQLKELYNHQPSTELYILLLSLSKQQVIVDFILTIDNNINQLEDFISPVEEATKHAINNNITGAELIKIQQEALNGQTHALFNSVKNPNSTYNKLMDKIKLKNERAKNRAAIKIYQQFFTPKKIVDKMLKESRQLLIKSRKIQILEPSAGSGNIVAGILQMRDGVHIDMVEIVEENRILLKELIGNNNDILDLKEQGDFLKYQNDICYDLIVMNPPYHLRKDTINNYDTDKYDMDHVIHAFKMLHEGGELVALVRTENAEKIRYAEWIKENKGMEMKFNSNWEGSAEKGEQSKIAKINLTLLRLEKPHEIFNEKTNTIKNRR